MKMVIKNSFNPYLCEESLKIAKIIKAQGRGQWSRVVRDACFRWAKQNQTPEDVDSGLKKIKERRKYDDLEEKQLLEKQDKFAETKKQKQADREIELEKEKAAQKEKNKHKLKRQREIIGETCRHYSVPKEKIPQLVDEMITKRLKPGRYLQSLGYSKPEKKQKKPAKKEGGSTDAKNNNI